MVSLPESTSTTEVGVLPETQTAEQSGQEGASQGLFEQTLEQEEGERQEMNPGDAATNAGQSSSHAHLVDTAVGGGDAALTGLPAGTISVLAAAIAVLGCFCFGRCLRRWWSRRGGDRRPLRSAGREEDGNQLIKRRGYDAEDEEDEYLDDQEEGNGGLDGIPSLDGLFPSLSPGPAPEPVFLE